MKTIFPVSLFVFTAKSHTIMRHLNNTTCTSNTPYMADGYAQRWSSYFLKVTHYLLLLPITKSNSLQLHITQEIK